MDAEEVAAIERRLLGVGLRDVFTEMVAMTRKVVSGTMRPGLYVFGERRLPFSYAANGSFTPENEDARAASDFFVAEGLLGPQAKP